MSRSAQPSAQERQIPAHPEPQFADSQWRFRLLEHRSAKHLSGILRTARSNSSSTKLSDYRVTQGSLCGLFFGEIPSAESSQHSE